MKSKLFGLITILLVGITFFVFAQNKETEKSIDDLYLENPEVAIIREQAYSDDRQTKMEALAGIEQMIADETATPEIEDYLIIMSTEGTTTKRYEGRTLMNNYPEVRRKACNLMGKLGGEKSIDALISILRTDTETMVLSEAAYALGVIGRLENGKVVRALADTIELQTVVNPDSNFAYAVILAFQKLAEANQGLQEAAGYRALIKIAQGNYIKSVKQGAIDTLKDLKKYN